MGYRRNPSQCSARDCVGLTKAYWKVVFNNEVEISVRTAANDAGHVAAGAWWTMSFASKQKLQLYASKPLSVQASFRVNVVVAKCATGHEWLRVALACAIQRVDGSVARATSWILLKNLKT